MIDVVLLPVVVVVVVVEDHFGLPVSFPKSCVQRGVFSSQEPCFHFKTHLFFITWEGHISKSLLDESNAAGQ